MSLIHREWEDHFKGVLALTHYAKPWAELSVGSSLLCLDKPVIEYHVASDNCKFQTRQQMELLENP